MGLSLDKGYLSWFSPTLIYCIITSEILKAPLYKGTFGAYEMCFTQRLHVLFCVCVSGMCSLEWPTSDQEWIALTRRHLESHEAERQQWLDTLAALVTSLDQVRTHTT